MRRRGRTVKNDLSSGNGNAQTVPVEARRQQNLQRAVSSLPPELVLLVFKYVKDTITHESWRRRTIVDQKSWIPLTHVYHLWRNIALCATHLWTDIQISSSNNSWASEMLLRSKQSPLIARVEFDDPNQRTKIHRDVNGALTALEKNLWRCRQVSLLGVTNDTFSQFFHTNGDATQLHTLRLATNPLSEYSKRMPKLSDQLLGFDTLRQLTLISGELDFRASFLRRLTHLKIRRYSTWEADSFLDFLKILPQMFALEMLDIDHTFTRSYDTFPDIKVALPNLKDLRLSGSIRDIANVISVLVPPASINVRLEAWQTIDVASQADSVECCCTVLKSLSSIFASPSSNTSLVTLTPQQPIRSYRLYHDLQGKYKFQAFREQISQHDMVANDFEPFVDCMLECGTLLDDEEMTFISALLDTLPLSHLVTMQVVSTLPLPIEIWAEIFRKTPSLQSILLCGEGSPLQIFDTLGFGRKKGSPTPSPLPSLETIFLHGSDLVGQSPEAHRSLLSHLESLVAVGSWRPRVIIFGPSTAVYEGIIDDLRKFVDHVESHASIFELDKTFEDIIRDAEDEFELEFEMQGVN